MQKSQENENLIQNAEAEQPKPQPKKESLSNSQKDQVRKSQKRTSNSKAERFSAGGKTVTTGNRNVAAANKKANLIALVIVVVGLVLAVAAIIPSALCSLLWWDWIWTLTAPALVIAIVSLVLFLLKKKEAALSCVAFAIIMSLAAIIWGSLEVTWANSYQGPLIYEKHYNARNADWIWKLKEVKKKLDNEKDAAKKAYIYHTSEFASKCHGEAYDWDYVKGSKIMKVDCSREAEEWYAKQVLNDTASKYAYCQMGDESFYPRVDSYMDSPVYKTHEKWREAKKYKFNENPADKRDTEKERAKKLKKFCEKFDVEAFRDLREKCDEFIEKNFEPACVPEQDGMLFKKGYLEPPAEDTQEYLKWRDNSTLEARLEANNPCGKELAKSGGGTTRVYQESKYYPELIETEIRGQLADPMTSTKFVQGPTDKVELPHGKIMTCEASSKLKEKERKESKHEEEEDGLYLETYTIKGRLDHLNARLADPNERKNVGDIKREILRLTGEEKDIDMELAELRKSNPRAQMGSQNRISWRQE